MAITNFQQLDPNKIKKAYDAWYTQEDIQNKLRSRWILPKQDISDKTFSWTNWTTWVNNVWWTPASSFKQAQWYKEWQVWMEGINLYKWVTPKADITTQPSEWTTPKTDTTTWVTPKTDTTTPESEIQSTYQNLTWNELDDKITELQKKVSEWQLTAEELAETQRQMQYYESVKRDEDYLTQQRERQQQVDTLTWEISDIQSSQRIRQAKQSLQTMKANIAYLWNMWRPWQSSAKLDAIAQQIEEWDKVYNELVTIESKYKKARELWEESKAAEFERQMDDLQRDLDDNVNSTLQDALAQIDIAEIDGLLDTPEEMEKFKEILFQNVDLTVAEISDRQWRKMNDLLTIYQDDANRRKEFIANKNTVNEEMSTALWYYVDGNGTPLINTETWQRINIPKYLPQDYQSFTMWNDFFATRLDANGNVMYDENGMPMFSKTSLVDNVTFEEQTMQNYATMFARWQIDIWDLQSMWLSQWQIANVVSQSAWIETMWDTWEWAKINDTTLYNKTTWQFKNIETWEITYWEWIDYSILDFSTNQDLINRYPNEAAFKNNNPTWLTWGISDNLKQLFTDAWIQYSIWSPRPEAEWWNYIKFNSVEDWLKAYQIALTQAWSDNVYNRLATWVWTTDTATNDRYAKDLMEASWIPMWTRFSELDENQLQSLMANQLYRESPNFYNELMNYEPAIQISWREEQIFSTANSMTWKQKVDYLKDEWLYEKYLNYQAKKKEQFWWVYAEDVAFDITSILPRDLYRTDADFDRVIRKVESSMSKLQSQWIELTPENIANDIRWWNLWEWVNQELAEDLKRVLTRNNTETDRIQWTTVSNLLNEWKDVEADRYIRNMVDDFVKTDLWTDAIDTTTMNQVAEDNRTLNNLIANNPDKIGAFDWRVNEFMRKFKDYPEMQELQTLLTMNQADIRKYFAWSAVTDSEMTALVDYIGWNTKMTPNNLLTMLNTIKNRTESLYIKQREKYWYTPKQVNRDTWKFEDEKWNQWNITVNSSDEEIINYLNK